MQGIARNVSRYSPDRLEDVDLKRRVKKLSVLDDAALPDDKFSELLGAIASMESNYAKAKFCAYGDETKCGLTLDPELTEIFANHRDAAELKYYWVQWHNATGAPTRADFQKYVDLKNEAARLNGESAGGEIGGRNGIM